MIKTLELKKNKKSEILHPYNLGCNINEITTTHRQIKINLRLLIGRNLKRALLRMNQAYAKSDLIQKDRYLQSVPWNFNCQSVLMCYKVAN